MFARQRASLLGGWCSACGGSRGDSSRSSGRGRGSGRGDRRSCRNSSRRSSGRRRRGRTCSGSRARLRCSGRCRGRYRERIGHNGRSPTTSTIVLTASRRIEHREAHEDAQEHHARDQRDRVELRVGDEMHEERGNHGRLDRRDHDRQRQVHAGTEVDVAGTDGDHRQHHQRAKGLQVER